MIRSSASSRIEENPIHSESDVSLPRRAIIAGGGLAGASLGYHLLKSGMKEVILFEKEELPGLHSSGRNAAMVRQITPDEELSRLARKGVQGLLEIGKQIEELDGSTEFFDQRGSLLLASGIHCEALQSDVKASKTAGLKVDDWSHQETTQRFPFLSSANFQRAAFCPSDGVVDVARLLDFYLRSIREFEGQVFFQKTIDEIRSSQNGFEAVRVNDEWIEGDLFINAAGGWASQLASLAGLAELPLNPTRRHLFVSPPRIDIPSDLPFIWDTTKEIYFRPEAGGILISACDITEVGELLEDDRVHPEIFDLLKGKIDSQFPALEDLAIKKGWSGVRTLTADGRFVIGEDPRLNGFFWMAGLGGHGVTTSYSVGELGAQLILGQVDPALNLHSPARFLSNGKSSSLRLTEELPRSVL